MIHIKSALKYSRSNIGNQQGDLQWRIPKKKKKPKEPILGGVFHVWFFSGLGFFGTKSNLLLN